MSIRVRYNLVIKQQGKQYKQPCIPHMWFQQLLRSGHICFYLFLFFSLVKYLKEMPIIKSFQPHILTYGKNGCFLT